MLRLFRLGSRNDHRPMAETRRGNLFSLPCQLGDPQSDARAEQGCRHTRGCRHCWARSMLGDHQPALYTHLSWVCAGALFTTMLWFPLCFFDLLCTKIGSSSTSDRVPLSLPNTCGIYIQSTKGSRQIICVFSTLLLPQIYEFPAARSLECIYSPHQSSILILSSLPIFCF